MRKSRKRVETEVADYWLTHDSAEEIDWITGGISSGRLFRVRNSA
jgi:hypothetical protein